MSYFWAKCGKILTESNKPVKCDNPPCGYYTIIGIKFRSLNDDGTPYNNCGWEYDVQAYNVKDNKITWNYYGPSICIEVNRNKGLCGHKIYWHYEEYCYCYDGDCEWESIDCDEECPSGCQKQRDRMENWHYEMFIYNIAGCFDDYNEFAEYFYSGCGVEPSSTGTYPSIWETSYGYTYMTTDAYNCVYNYWNKIFADKYLLCYSLIKYSMVQWWVSGVTEKYKEECYCWGDDCENPGEIDCSQSCGEGCFKEEGSGMEQQSAGPWALQTTNQYERGSTVNEFYSGNFDFTKTTSYGTYWYMNCCDENNFLRGAGPATSYMKSKVADKNSYTTGGSNTTTCENSNNLCLNFSYKASPYDNNYGTYWQIRHSINWAKLKLERTSSTPASANGVKFLMKMTRYKRNEGYQRGSEEKTESSSYISLNFGQTYEDLPLPSHINGISLVQEGNCDGDCEWNSENYRTATTQPHVTFWYQDYYPNDVYTDEYSISLSGVEYI